MLLRPNKSPKRIAKNETKSQKEVTRSHIKDMLDTIIGGGGVATPDGLKRSLYGPKKG
jgi:hypothetical protein